MNYSGDGWPKLGAISVGEAPSKLGRWYSPSSIRVKGHPIQAVNEGVCFIQETIIDMRNSWSSKWGDVFLDRRSM